jgi:hypothetical protein
MARVFNLANYNRTTVIDLIRGTFKVDKFSWVTSTTDARIRYDYTPFGAQPSFEYYQPVAEVFNLTSCIGGAEALKALHQLQDVMEGVRRYHDGVPTVESWWLEWNSEDEDPKRALIYTMTLDFPVTRNVTSNFMECYGTDIKMALTRHPLWETITADHTTDASVDNTGGIMALGTIDGTAPARIETLQVHPTATITSLVEHWFGIRPTHSGTAAFTPVWSCEFGTDGTDAVDAADGGTVSGNRVTVSFATNTTLVKRSGILLSNIEATTTDYPDYIGRYLVLCRCSVTAGTIGLQMRSGYQDNLIHEEIYVDNASYYLHELGEVFIPPWASHLTKGDSFLGTFQISLFAERVSGAGSLYLDCLILIPTEHFLYVNDAQIGATTHNLYVQTLEQDTTISYEIWTAPNPDQARDALEHIPKLWYIPTEGGILVYAGQCATAHVLGTPVDITLNYNPRWLAHRYD